MERPNPPAALRLSPDHAHPHGHDHGHAHDPALIRPPGFSLLRASLALRLGFAAAFAALIWAGVAWAIVWSPA